MESISRGIYIAAAVTLVLTGTGATAESGQAPEPGAPIVIGSYLHRPPNQATVRVAVRNTAHPSPSRVVRIAALEQRRWGGPSILGRIACESTYRWWADNGTYEGLLQFGPIWGSMWPGTPRTIKWITRKVVRKKAVLWSLWSDGGKTREIVGHPRQWVRVIHRGKLPKSSDPFHGWAAIRVGQRAVSGDGPTTGWECSL